MMMMTDDDASVMYSDDFTYSSYSFARNARFFMCLWYTMFVVCSLNSSDVATYSEWPKKVRTPGVLIIQNHMVLKSALKEVRKVVQGFDQVIKRVHRALKVQILQGL